MCVGGGGKVVGSEWSETSIYNPLIVAAPYISGTGLVSCTVSTCVWTYSRQPTLTSSKDRAFLIQGHLKNTKILSAWMECPYAKGPGHGGRGEALHHRLSCYLRGVVHFTSVSQESEGNQQEYARYNMKPPRQNLIKLIFYNRCRVPGFNSNKGRWHSGYLLVQTSKVT